MSKTSLGVNENVAGLLAYALGWISGLIVILLEKENKVVRFHAMQSIITFGALSILSIFFSISHTFYWASSLIGLAGIVLWVVLMVKAYQGERFQLPVIGELAEEWAPKFKF